MFSRCILVSWMVFSLAPFSVGAVFQSNVAVQATFPDPAIDSNIYYRVFEGTPRSAVPPFHTCVLIHGHGISSDIISAIRTFGDTKPFSPLVGLLDQSGAGETVRGILGGIGPEPTPGQPRGLGNKVDALGEMDVLTAFSNFYQGRSFREKLLASACSRVIVAVQESTQSSILEMTVRTERFLKEVACRPVNLSQRQWPCAIIGHSKGGAVATSIVRRCMAAQPARKTGEPLYLGGSDLGEATCRGIGLVYALAGTNEGVGMTVALAGLIASDRQRQAAEKSDSSVVKFFAETVTKNPLIAEGLKRLRTLKSAEKKLRIDLVGEKTDQSNPTWYDLSPIALVDGVSSKDPSRRLTIAEQHGPDFRVMRNQGWFRGYYVAGGTRFHFDRLDAAGTVGWGTLPKEMNGLNRPPLISPERRPLVRILRSLAQDGSANSGLQGGPPEPGLPRETLKSIESEIQKIPPREFLFEPFLSAQQVAVTVFSQEVMRIHRDPLLPAGFPAGLAELKRLVLSNKQSTGEAAARLLDYFVLDRSSALFRADESDFFKVFQESDGFVEYGTAVGICLRSQHVEDPNQRAVLGCTEFKSINHLANSGIATEVADDILKYLNLFSSRSK